jgi:hypothetical protein
MFLLRPVVVVRAALVALVWAAWLLWAPLRVKAESVLVATVYSAIEFTWCVRICGAKSVVAEHAPRAGTR